MVGAGNAATWSTLFPIEPLQPSSLGTRTHRIAYALGSRVAAGLIFAMIGGLGNLAKYNVWNQSEYGIKQCAAGGSDRSTHLLDGFWSHGRHH